jgi:hypothetical protein
VEPSCLDTAAAQGVFSMARHFRCLALLLSIFAACWFTAPAPACPFCNQQGQTLTGEINQAALALYGTLSNPREDTKTGGAFGGTTDLNIELVVKGHPILANPKVVPNPKVLVLKRYLPLEPAGKFKYLVFADVFKDDIDPYRALPVKSDSDLAAYLKGVLGMKDKKQPERLRYFFDYLDNDDIEISNDALKEFANADYGDYKDMATKLPADKVAGWLKDPKTPGVRIGLYASLLGHCGKSEHAALLRAILDDPEKRYISGIDGILAAYTMLEPKAGRDYITAILKDGKKEFLLRYAALRAVRFFWEYRTDLMSKADSAQTAALLLSQNDIADLAIEDLRKWQSWDLADRVIGLRKTSAFEVPIVRRSILRYALQAKGSPVAEAYVAEQRKKDAQAVADAEELLKLELPRPAGTEPPKDTPKVPPITGKLP